MLPELLQPAQLAAAALLAEFNGLLTQMMMMSS